MKPEQLPFQIRLILRFRFCGFGEFIPFAGQRLAKPAVEQFFLVNAAVIDPADVFSGKSKPKHLSLTRLAAGAFIGVIFAFRANRAAAA